MNGNMKTGNAHSGFGMIELLVAIAIGMLLVAVMGQIYISSKQTYNTSDAVARIQENGRFALIKLSEDLRMAGFWGCGSGGLSIQNNLNPAGVGYTAELYDYSDGIVGQDGATDIINVGYSINSGIKVVQQMPNVSANIKVTPNEVLGQGDIVLVCDVQQGDIFQITNMTASGGIAAKDTVVHNSGNTTEPGNYNPVSCSPGVGAGGMTHCLSKSYDTNARLMQPIKVRYWVATGAAGTPALFRSENGVAAELVEGIENMQIRYGVDTTGDLAVDSYADATGVADWSLVMSVRVSFLVRSPENNVVQTAQTYTYDSDGNGVVENITAADRRLRQVFTTTVNLRNRTL